MSFGQLTLALEARGLLADRPGFPDVRVRWSPYRDTCHTVAWGKPAPAWWEDDVVFGRFFGYSEAAIARFVERHQQAISATKFRAATGLPCERAGHDPPAP